MKKIIYSLFVIIIIYSEPKEDIIKKIEDALVIALIKYEITTLSEAESVLKHYIENKIKREKVLLFCQKKGITDANECLEDYYGVAVNRVLEKLAGHNIQNRLLEINNRRNNYYEQLKNNKFK
jgi:hypothetical protein